jgi:hypothetical protein
VICSSFPKAFNQGAMNAHPDSGTFAKANVQEIPIVARHQTTIGSRTLSRKTGNAVRVM